MEQIWVFDQLAVSVTRVDFLDPELEGTPEARERGVRIELRPTRSVREGSIYASDPLALEPAICRVDLLESAPGAADRMHWHPDMYSGEPGERTFDPTMPPDPVGWIAAFLDSLDGFLSRLDPPDVVATAADLHAIRAASDGIATAVSDGLAWARQPWPDVVRDDRGMALA